MWGTLNISERLMMKSLAEEPSTLTSILADDERHRLVLERSKGKVKTYDDFLTRVVACKSCPIHGERVYPPVPPKGPLDAYYMVLGRNPGKQEGQQGQPFYEKAPGGNLLNQYLLTLGIGRPETYITNSLFCWTYKDRAPLVEETVKCSLWKGIEFSFLTQVKFVFLLGNDAVRSFISMDHSSITKYYGRTYLYDDKTRGWGNVIVHLILHPGSLLRNNNLTTIVNHQLEYINHRYISNFKTFLEGQPTKEQIRDWKG